MCKFPSNQRMKNQHKVALFNHQTGKVINSGMPTVDVKVGKQFPFLNIHPRKAPAWVHTEDVHFSSFYVSTDLETNFVAITVGIDK